MEAFMKKIAVVILTKNEEKNIVAVIENVRKITEFTWRKGSLP